MIFLYRKVKDAMDKMETLFKTPLDPKSSKDLNEIRNILINNKKKDLNNIYSNKLMKIETNTLLRNNSFNLVNSYKHKKYTENYLFLSEKNKANEDLNVSF